MVWCRLHVTQVLLLCSRGEHWRSSHHPHLGWNSVVTLQDSNVRAGEGRRRKGGLEVKVLREDKLSSLSLMSSRFPALPWQGSTAHGEALAGYLQDKNYTVATLALNVMK